VVEAPCPPADVVPPTPVAPSRAVVVEVPPPCPPADVVPPTPVAPPRAVAPPCPPAEVTPPRPVEPPRAVFPPCPPTEVLPPPPVNVPATPPSAPPLPTVPPVIPVGPSPRSDTAPPVACGTEMLASTDDVTPPVPGLPPWPWVVPPAPPAPALNVNPPPPPQPTARDAATVPTIARTILLNRIGYLRHGRPSWRKWNLIRRLAKLAKVLVEVGRASRPRTRSSLPSQFR
jgi:hypothetical protein